MKIINCKNCKYFYKDIWGVVNGQPQIIKHNECTQWKDCATDPEGFCYKGKSKKEED